MPAARPLLRALPLLESPQSPTAEDFAREGFVILRSFLPDAERAQLLLEAQALLDPLSAPVEFESEVHSPAAGRAPRPARIPRRLRYAFGRHPLFRAWAQRPDLVEKLRELAWPEAGSLWLTQNHHNCVMTKMPEHSSETGWHQDIRYWNFERGDLVTAWLALTSEKADNGALQIVPKSHLLDLPDEAFDEHRFLRDDHPRGQALLAQAAQVELEPGDLLLFHCRLLHAARSNQGSQPKLALVFSYRHEQDRPRPQTRSSRVPDLRVTQE